MKPSLSLILFTLLAGAGYGLFVATVAQVHFGSVPLTAGERRSALLLALLLIAVGLSSSVFHLANKRNAWKALSRLRTSWLSREALFALLFFVPALLYLIGHGWGDNAHTSPAWLRMMGWLGVLLALATVFSTAMIYTSLKTIRQWHNPLVPINYLLLALASGGVLLAAVRGLSSGQPAGIVPVTLVLLGAALLVKLAYYVWIGRPAGPTPDGALGLSRTRVRLLDVGHSHGTFLTDEFGQQVSRPAAMALRGAVILLAFVLPMLLLLYSLNGQPPVWTALAALVMLIGLFIERWLFFAEGRHVVMLYHGRQRT